MLGGKNHSQTFGLAASALPSIRFPQDPYQLWHMCLQAQQRGPMPLGEGKHHIRQNEGLETTCSNYSQNRIHFTMLYGSPNVTLQQYAHQYQTNYVLSTKNDG